MHGRVLLDTGPLVAILNRNDSEHETCVGQLAEVATPLLTCWPVLVEAAWLLRANPSAIQELLLSCNKGLLNLLSMDDTALPWIASFFRKYRRRSPQLADAALVYLAERENLDTIFTLDRTDFTVYRTSTGRTLRIL